MRKQYKITSLQQVEEKILKYLRFRANRKVKGESEGEIELNLSADSKDSKDSKESRERSREVKLERQDISYEAINERGSLFDGVFEVDAHLAEAVEEQAVENRILNLYISDQAAEDKELKRTWEEEYEVFEGQISLGMVGGGGKASENWWVNSLVEGRDMFAMGLEGFMGHAEPIQPIVEVREVQANIACGRYEYLMIDDWLFHEQWENLEE